jgi:hypothetical protein
MTQKEFEGLLGFSFYACVILCIFAVMIHQKTVIDAKTPWIVAMTGAIIATSLLWKILKKRTIKWTMRLFFCFTYGAASFYFALLCLNYVSANEPVTIESFAIESKELKYGKYGKSVSVKFDFNGVTHELKYPKSVWPDVQQADSIRINYSKGLFGFPVVKSHEYE